MLKFYPAFSGTVAAIAFSIGSTLHAAETTLGVYTFTLPDGFEIELVAGPPLVERPIAACFDEQGRLYVADSSGSNAKVEAQLAEKPHRIVRLEDTDGDGRFDRSVVFADRMMFPAGALWLDGSLYVGAPPSIWKLTDKDGDGVAEHREEWFQGKTLTGCANDLHGPFVGPDGWIYWCKGAFAEQTHERAGRAPIKDRAAHIFRSRPDGRDLEVVMSGGMDNPVEVAFTRTGEPIFTSTFIDLSGEGKRDGLAHAVYGGVFPKVHDVIDEITRTGPLLPVMTHMGPGAPSGICRAQSTAMGFQDDFFATLFNLHKVTRHTLEPSGATFRTKDADFVSSTNADFHPTDVLEDADGSLLIVDTGGWYKLCCPTSQLAKPDVLGAIYRVRRKGAVSLADPRGAKIPWEDLDAEGLAVFLGDARHAVVGRAVDRLAKLTGSSEPALRKVLAARGEPAAREKALWVLSRTDSAAARAAVRSHLQDATPDVQRVALKIAALWRDPEAAEAVQGLLKTAHGSGDAPLARTAAEALGRIGSPTAVPGLLAAASSDDRFLEHAIIFALIEIGDPKRTALGVADPAPATQRAALIALDQMPGGKLAPETVVPFLASKNRPLQEAATWIVGRHGDWGAALADYFSGRLTDQTLSPQDRNELEALLAQSARDPGIQQLLARSMEKGTPSTRATALRAIGRTELPSLPADWKSALALLLSERDAEVLREAIGAAKVFASRKETEPKLDEELLTAARDKSVPEDLRLEALAAIKDAIPGDASLVKLLQSLLSPEKSPSTRGLAAGVLAKTRLTDAQRETLADLLPQLGPLDAGKLLPVFGVSPSETLGRRVIASLEKSPALFSLQPQALRAVFSQFPAELQPAASALLAKLNIDPAGQKAHLDRLEVELPPGDLRRGQAIFNGNKAACSMCHSMGFLGGKFGPDLTSVGTVRGARDLLEAIVYPSASFVRSFEPVIVQTASGEEIFGMLKNESKESITLTTSPGADQRIARAQIAEMRPGAASLMPAGMDQILTRQELADLLAFLQGTRWGAK